MLDQEGIDLDFNQTEKDAITFAVCALKTELNKTLPGNMVAWSSDVGSYFDYAALTEKGCVDLWMDMAYCWCIDYEDHSTTRDRAPTPIDFIADIVSTYEKKFKVCTCCQCYNSLVRLPFRRCTLTSGTGACLEARSDLSLVRVQLPVRRQGR